MYKKIIICILVIAAIGMMFFFFREDTAKLERNLYYDMEDINRLAIEFMTEMVNKVSGGYYNETVLTENIKLMEKKVNNLQPPRHLKDEVDDWAEQIKLSIEIFRQMKSGYPVYLGNEQLEAFDHGRERIYDGFKKFSP